jgi:MYXO-CTERM domain-containing protein
VTDGREEGNILLENARTTTQKKMAAAALAGLLSAGALTAAGEVAEAQTQVDGGEVVNREVQVTEDRDYTGLWGLLGLLGLAGLAGLRRKRDDGADVRRVPSAERDPAVRGSSPNGGGHDVRRGIVRDSEVVSSTEGRTGARDGSGDTNVRRVPSGR